MCALIAALLSGCGEEIVSDAIAVPGQPPEATPVTAFRHTLGEAALALAFVGQVIEDDGTVDVAFSDGSTLTGMVDVDTGEFDLLLELPNGYFLQSVRDSGRFDLDGVYIVGASYREEYDYLNGTQARWDVAFDVDNDLELSATDVDRGTEVSSLVRLFESRTDIIEDWHLAGTYRESITVRYRDGDPVVEQRWVRDELTTEVSPDRSAEFEFNEDGSGTGRLDYYYDHGITAVYEFAQDSEGDATETIVFEDPGTEVTPDGEGLYTFQRDNSGSGTYTERYDDGSELVMEQTFGVLGTEDTTFAFDEAATPWAPDADGESYTYLDGSGFGTWRRHDADGVIETCDYEFDTAGNIQQIDCD